MASPRSPSEHNLTENFFNIFVSCQVESETSILKFSLLLLLLLFKDDMSDLKNKVQKVISHVLVSFVLLVKLLHHLFRTMNTWCFKNICSQSFCPNEKAHSIARRDAERWVKKLSTSSKPFVTNMGDFEILSKEMGLVWDSSYSRFYYGCSLTEYFLIQHGSLHEKTS